MLEADGGSDALLSSTDCPAGATNPAPVADAEKDSPEVGSGDGEDTTGTGESSKSNGKSPPAEGAGNGALSAESAEAEEAGEDAHATSTGGSEAEGDEDSAADSEGTQDFSDDDDEGKDGYKKGGYHPVLLLMLSAFSLSAPALPCQRLLGLFRS
jgi:hypothetical protein